MTLNCESLVWDDISKVEIEIIKQSRTALRIDSGKLSISKGQKEKEESAREME